MTLEEAIWREKALAVSFRKRIESMETTDTTPLERLEHEHWQMEHWLKELKKYRAIFEKVGEILADNGYTIDDLDTIFGKANGEVKADGDSD